LPVAAPLDCAVPATAQSEALAGALPALVRSIDSPALSAGMVKSAGAAVPLTPVGQPARATAIGPVNPPSRVTWTARLACAPGRRLFERGFGAIRSEAGFDGAGDRTGQCGKCPALRGGRFHVLGNVGNDQLIRRRGSPGRLQSIGH